MWKYFKKYTLQKINISTQNLVLEELRVYCQYSGCNTNYKHKSGGSTRNMCTHLKKHNIIDEDEEQQREETDSQQPATIDQVTNILYYMVMFIVTAGLSFRTIQNKYFKMLITEYFKVSFSWPGRKKIRKLVNKYATEKADKIKKKLEEAKSVSITADGWTSKFQKLSNIFRKPSYTYYFLC